MPVKLIAAARIRYNGVIYEEGNSFLCDSDEDAEELIRDKAAKPYPKPSPEVIARKIEEGKLKPEDVYPRKKSRRRSRSKAVSIVTAIKDNLQYLEMAVDAVYKNTRNKFEYIIIVVLSAVLK